MNKEKRASIQRESAWWANEFA